MRSGAKQFVFTMALGLVIFLVLITAASALGLLS